MQREPAVLGGSIASSQERFKLEDKAASACNQVTQAVARKQGKNYNQASSHSGQECSLRWNLDASISAAVQVRLEWHNATAPPNVLLPVQALLTCLVIQADMPLECTASLSFSGIHGTMHS